MAIFSNTVNYLDGGTLLQAFFAYDNAFEGRHIAMVTTYRLPKL
jgi:hypothetical protein